MLGKLSICNWDVIWFSQTQKSSDCKLARSLFCTSQDEAVSACVGVLGVGVLVHARHTHPVKKTHAVGSRTIYIDVDFDGVHRLISCYMPRAGYPMQICATCMPNCALCWQKRGNWVTALLWAVTSTPAPYGDMFADLLH